MDYPHLIPKGYTANTFLYHRGRIIGCANGYYFYEDSQGEVHKEVSRNKAEARVREDFLTNIIPSLTKPLLFEAHKRYVFTYNGKAYLYRARRTYLEREHVVSDNDAILVAVFGDDYKDKLKKIYGYRPGFGNWPEWRDDDLTAGQKVFDALVERGVEITRI